MDGMEVVGDLFGVGTDVPAPGRQERAGDEARRRLPRAVHGGREGRDGNGRGRGKVVLATVKGDVHDIGKNIVGVVLGCNNYEVIDLGVMVPGGPDPRHGRGGGLRRRRPLGADHAVARRDGPRRRRDGAARARPAAPDRRRHDFAPAHRREDRARVRAADPARPRRLARRRGRLRPARARSGGSVLDHENRAAQERLRELHEREGAQAAAPSRAGARAPDADRVACGRSSRAGLHRACAVVEAPLGDAARLRRLDVLLPRLGAEGPLPARSSTTRSSARRRATCTTNANELLDEIVAGELLRGARRLRLLACARGGRRRRARERRRASPCCASRPTTGTRGRTARWPTSSPRRRRAWPTMSARSPSRPGSAPTSSRDRFDAEHDDYRSIMVKALADRLAEAFAEHLHEAGAARVVRDRRAALHRRADRRELSAASGPRSATRPAPTIRRRGRCSSCSERRRSGWSSPRASR